MVKMVNFVLCVFPQKHFLRSLLFSDGFTKCLVLAS